MSFSIGDACLRIYVDPVRDLPQGVSQGFRPTLALAKLNEQLSQSPEGVNEICHQVFARLISSTPFIKTPLNAYLSVGWGFPEPGNCPGKSPKAILARSFYRDRSIIVSTHLPTVLLPESMDNGVQNRYQYESHQPAHSKPAYDGVAYGVPHFRTVSFG